MADFYNTVKVKSARKPHTCDECGSSIHIGQSYRYTKGVLDSKFYTLKLCSECSDLRNLLDENDFDFTEWTESLQSAAFEFALQEPWDTRSYCPIRSELPGVGRNSKGKWVVDNTEPFINK